MNIQVKWIVAAHGYYKLNVDGAARGNPGNAGIGGVLRDFKGDFIAGFMNYIGFNTNNESKLLALWNGLKMAKELQITNIILETDSILTLNYFDRDRGPLTTKLVNLAQDCRLMLTEFDNS
ncbi:hypothetical protein Salat_2422900, partial [Sesamum alatum]